MDDDTPVRFDTRIAVLLRDDLLPWQELNVTAFLISGLAAEPQLLGEPYEDADGIRYLPLLGQRARALPVAPVRAAARSHRHSRQRAAGGRGGTGGRPPR